MTANLVQQQQHRPALAAALSIIPGIGQLYNRRFIKGSLFFLLSAALLIALYDFLNIGFWGIYTLGTIPMVDDSRALLVQGLLSVILVVFLLLFYAYNLVDAYRDGQKLRSGYAIPSMKESFHAVWDRGFPYYMVLPGFFILVFVVVFPLLFMISLAFTNYNLYNSPPAKLLDWVGFDNFTTLFTEPIWRSSLLSVLSWTVVWTFVATTLQIVVALLLAVMVNDARVKFKRLIRTIFILPWAVPSFVTILIFAAMFNDDFGAINRELLAPFGVQIPWMSDPVWAKVTIIMIQVWLGFPFVFALFSGVLQSISNDWYEAADVDGGSRWNKFRHITLPHVLYATAPLLIMQYAGNFNNFNIIYLFNEGGPPVRNQTAGGTDILISWVYKLTFENNNYKMAAAISIIMGLVVAIFAFFQFSRSRSFREEKMF
ncbi:MULTISPECIES: carbohydrate ABC transporter permease [Paenibacillus]|uniref:Maltose/maltodextrin transport system permease protein n=1 Tax=Paenibacillus campinasensis TaxID=66347 RepID=A0ABW9T330_9BACL|nr:MULTISPECIES: sugar ABC transporter permease [Paenibacillus]MUG67690.1 ABC transporter permease subunit [Paenibacillus campinasensis]PAK55616.1 sugar ABC transporter permease [Paenibacillus sp. 7541]